MNEANISGQCWNKQGSTSYVRIPPGDSCERKTHGCLCKNTNSQTGVRRILNLPRCIFNMSIWIHGTSTISSRGPFEYDRADSVLALARQYSRIHWRKMLRGEGFHELEDPQVLIPTLVAASACLKTILSFPLVSTIVYCSFVSCTATIKRL